MKDEIVRINSVSQLHEIMELDPPQHPLISIIDANRIQMTQESIGIKIIYDFYMVSMKDKSCGMEYGRNSFDFNEGVMIFSAPGQVHSPTRAIEAGEISGWMMLFHPDLIRNTHLGTTIEDYSFFNYDVFEALHLSDEEELIMNECVQNIQREYEQRIDNLSQRVLTSNIELLLNYSLRYYERQFNTRTTQSKDVVTQFESELKTYFAEDLQLKSGIPEVGFFAEKANLSKHYFSDLMKKETGRTAKDHINEYLIAKAKTLLLSTQQSISEIAYDLGFNYPHYFTRLFKAKTGTSPSAFREVH